MKLNNFQARHAMCSWITTRDKRTASHQNSLREAPITEGQVAAHGTAEWLQLSLMREVSSMKRARTCKP